MPYHWKLHGKGEEKKKNKVGISKASRTPRIPCSPYRLGDALKTLAAIDLPCIGGTLGISFVPSKCLVTK
jgi:hypothetical protein